MPFHHYLTTNVTTHNLSLRRDSFTHMCICYCVTCCGIRGITAHQSHQVLEAVAGRGGQFLGVLNSRRDSRGLITASPQLFHLNKHTPNIRSSNALVFIVFSQTCNFLDVILSTLFSPFLTSILFRLVFNESTHICVFVQE